MSCPACEEKRIHTEGEWNFHPFRGHGFTREQGWTHPALVELALKAAVEKSKAESSQKQSEAKP